MWGLLVAGAVSGVVLGYVLQRSDLCFHSAWRGTLDGRFHLAKIWILGVAIAAVGLGAWFLGDVAGGRWLTGGDGLDLRGSTVELGDGPTAPDIIGVDRLVVAVVFLVVVVGLLARSRRGTATGNCWAWPLGGLALGLGTIAAWALAGASGSGFGPSTVGGPASLVNAGPVNTWLVAFLAFLVVGAVIAAWQSQTLWVRGEGQVRYMQLAVGGLLLGAGGQIGGGARRRHGRDVRRVLPQPQHAEEGSFRGRMTTLPKHRDDELCAALDAALGC